MNNEISKSKQFEVPNVAIKYLYVQKERHDGISEGKMILNLLEIMLQYDSPSRHCHCLFHLFPF